MPDSQNEQSPLSEKEQAFVSSFIVDGNATRAYRKAFGERDEKKRKRSYGAIRVAARSLLTNPNILAEIKAAKAEICRRNRVGPSRVVRELAAIAFADMVDLFEFDTNGAPLPLPARDIPERIRRAIQEIRHITREIPRGAETILETEVRYKLFPKQPALDKLYDHLGLDPKENQYQAFLSALPNDLREQVAKHLESLLAAESGKPDADPIPTDNSDEAGQTV